MTNSQSTSYAPAAITVGTRVRHDATRAEGTVHSVTKLGKSEYVNVQYDTRVVSRGTLGTDGHLGGGYAGEFSVIDPHDPWTV